MDTAQKKKRLIIINVIDYFTKIKKTKRNRIIQRKMNRFWTAKIETKVAKNVCFIFYLFFQKY